MYCRNCGEKNKFGSIECVKCGKKFTDISFKNQIDIRQNRINFFTKYAYNMIVSEDKYKIIFIILSSMTLALAFLVRLVPEFIPAVLSAIDITWGDNVEYRNINIWVTKSEILWRNVWCILIFCISSIITLISGVIVFIKAIKIYIKLKNMEMDI